jgi:AcrR family transcriptional regulator
MQAEDWFAIHTHVLQLEQEGLVTRTFRRLDPERQQAILLAILDEAADKGPASLNIKLVAERAGVSVGALYQYFKDRDGMLNFAVDLCARFLKEMLLSYRPLLIAMPLREGLIAYIGGGVEWSRTYMGLLRLFIRAAYQGEPTLSEKLVVPIATTLREIVADMLAQAIQRGEVRADIDLDSVIRLVHGLSIITGDSVIVPYLNAYFQIQDTALPPERVLNALVDLVLRGIGAAKEG